MNTATAITIGAIATLTPTVTCIIAYLFSRQDVRDLRAEFRTRADAQDAKIDSLRETVDARIDSLRETIDARIDSLRETIDARIDSLKDSSHKDALEIMRTMVALHERVAIVEARPAR